MPPPTMIDDLRTASSLLRTALGHYVSVCSDMARHYDLNGGLESISREIVDVILGEAELISSYQTNLKQAKAVIDQTHNRIPKMAPVNTLPTYVLSYIFELTLSAQSCHLENQDDRQDVPRITPELLIQVCSHWREVAIHSRGLWCHVDLALTGGRQYTQLFLERAITFAARSNPLPLDIHIFGRDIHRSLDSVTVDPRVHTFYSSIVSRAKSIKLPGRYSFATYQPLLHSYLKSSTPGALTELVTTGNRQASFLSFSGTPQALFSPDSLPPRDLSHQHIEERLLSIKILRLVGVYFHWGSQAYRGLVELHLAPLWGASGFSITRSQLAQILTSSPRLRSLELGLEIIDSYPQGVLNEPIKLEELEVLDLRSTRCTHYDTILQMISPASKPLRVSLRFPAHNFPLLFGTTIRDFLNNSNTTHLHIESTTQESLEIHEMIRALRLPKIEVLSLARFTLDDSSSYNYRQHVPSDTQAVVTNGLGPLPKCSRLNSLNLTCCLVDLDYFHRLIESFPVRALKMTGCSASSKEESNLRAQDWEHKRLENVPMVEFHEISGALEGRDPWD